MGEYFRRFWQPVCLSSQLRELPLAIKILGEELVAFRDKSGRVGLLNRHCSHRGTSLEFGQVENHGIRCCYHGWLFDIDGSILETPGEPPESRLKRSFCHGAYPAIEYHGIVHAYMGPPEGKPEFPKRDLFEIPGLTFIPSSIAYNNNWLQSYENNLDPIHSAFLHTRITQHFGAPFAVLPKLSWHVTSSGDGVFYIALRRLSDELIWVRMLHCILPNEAYVPSVFDLGNDPLYFQQAFHARRVVPNDDEHCTYFSWRISGKGFEGGEPEKNGLNLIDIGAQVEQPTYELKQKQPGDFEAQGGQRPVAVHALEHLGTTDGGVALIRRALRNVMNGERRSTETADHSEKSSLKNVYSGDSLLRISRRPDPAQDQEVLDIVGREVAQAVIAGDRFDGEERRQFIIGKIRAVEAQYQ
ncbi:MAG: Rieske 2Fe-2S domain-containing protein [Burkholderiales bacterium]